MSTFVTVGTARQSFARLLDAVAVLECRLPQPVVVQSGHTQFRSDVLNVVPFMSGEEYEIAVLHADLVITHAGGGSVLQALRVGHLPVIVPRLPEFGEIVDDHQAVWGKVLASTGRVVLVENVADLGNAIAQAGRRWAPECEEPTLVKLVAKAISRR